MNSRLPNDFNLLKNDFLVHLTQKFTANINRLMLFRETIAAYCENDMKKKYSVDRMESFIILKQVIHIETYIHHPR
jgi:hypothetical protein